MALPLYFQCYRMIGLVGKPCSLAGRRTQTLPERGITPQLKIQHEGIMTAEAMII
jgi:hypothetical protein